VRALGESKVAGVVAGAGWVVRRHFWNCGRVDDCGLHRRYGPLQFGTGDDGGGGGDWGFAKYDVGELRGAPAELFCWILAAGRVWRLSIDGAVVVHAGDTRWCILFSKTTCLK